MSDYDEILDLKPHSRTRGCFVPEERYQKLIALEREVERLSKRLEEISKIATEALDYGAQHHSDRDGLFKALWNIEDRAKGRTARGRGEKGE